MKFRSWNDWMNGLMLVWFKMSRSFFLHSIHPAAYYLSKQVNFAKQEAKNSNQTKPNQTEPSLIKKQFNRKQ